MKKIKYLVFLFVFATIFLFGSNVKAESAFYNITGLYLKNTEVDAGGKLYVDLNMIEKDESTEIIGYFYSGTMDNHKLIGLTLKDVLTDNPYFELSSYMLPGESFHLDSLYVKDSKDSKSYVTSPNGYNDYMNLQGKDTFKVKEYTLSDFSTTGVTTVKKDGKISFNINTNFDFEYVSIAFKNITAGTFPSMAYLQKAPNGTYTLDLTRTNDSSAIVDGEYKVTDINFFIGNQSLQYSSQSEGDGVMPFKFNATFNVKSEEQVIAPAEETVLTGVEVKSTTAKINDRVFVTLRSNKNIISAKLIFSNEKESMTVNLKNLTTEPNFTVPYTTGAGTYKLDYAIIKTVDGKQYQYRSGEDYYNIKHFDFNSTITIEETKTEADSLNLDNSKMTVEAIENLKKIESNVVVEIDASNNSVITKELFEAIKGTNKTLVIKSNDVEWTFNGLDVKTPKQIDVSTKIYNTSEESTISGKVQNGLVLDFADNDKLPGKCLIKLYNNEQLAQVLNKNNANIYYYNEKTGKFEEVKLNVEYNGEGYYEFYISHNSKYVITSEKIDSTYVDETKNSSNSTKSSNNNLVLWVAIPSAAVVVLLVILVLVLKSKKNKKNKDTKLENK